MRSWADGEVISYAYDVNGNRTSMTDTHGVAHYTYDALGRVTSVMTPTGELVAYGYDAVSHRTSLTYPNGIKVTYQFDPANRLSQVRDWLGRTTTYVYDRAGNKVALTLGNGANTTFSYDGANRLVGVVNQSGGRVLTSYSYTLDKLGNRVQVVDAAGGITRYAYDALNRVVAWMAPSGQTSTYGYDEVGNRVSLTNATGTTAYAYDASDRLLSAGTSSFTYDGNGNRLTKTTGATTWAYAFDSRNRLTGVSGGGIAAQYQYDGDGNRIGQQVGASSYQYVLDVVRRTASVLQESGPDGHIDFQDGLGKLSGSSATLEQFYQTDGLGSTADVTDATGTLKASYAYDPWGKLLNPIDPLGTKDKFKFAGDALDPQAGLYYMRARYYDPAIGQFISKDPFGGRASAPLTTAKYAYALDNPVRYVDHSGLSTENASSNVSSAGTLGAAMYFSVPWLYQGVSQLVSPYMAYGSGVLDVVNGLVTGTLGADAANWMLTHVVDVQETVAQITDEVLDIGSPPSIPESPWGGVTAVVLGAGKIGWSIGQAVRDAADANANLPTIATEYIDTKAAQAAGQPSGMVPKAPLDLSVPSDSTSTWSVGVSDQTVTYPQWGP